MKLISSYREFLFVFSDTDSSLYHYILMGISNMHILAYFTKVWNSFVKVRIPLVNWGSISVYSLCFVNNVFAINKFFKKIWFWCYNFHLSAPWLFLCVFNILFKLKYFLGIVFHLKDSLQIQRAFGNLVWFSFF